MSKSKPLTEQKEQTELLFVPLTALEVASFADDLARAIDRRATVDAQAKIFATTARDETKKLDAEIADLARLVRDKRELRDVVVEERKDFVRGVASVVRTDTGEIIRERAITTEERQTDLALVV